MLKITVYTLHRDYENSEHPIYISSSSVLDSTIKPVPSILLATGVGIVSLARWRGWLLHNNPHACRDRLIMIRNRPSDLSILFLNLNLAETW